LPISGYVDHDGKIRLINSRSYLPGVEEGRKGARYNFGVYVVESDGLQMLQTEADPVDFNRLTVLEFANDLSNGLLTLFIMFIDDEHKAAAAALTAFTSTTEVLRSLSRPA